MPRINWTIPACQLDRFDMWQKVVAEGIGGLGFALSEVVKTSTSGHDLSITLSFDHDDSPEDIYPVMDNVGKTMAELIPAFIGKITVFAKLETSREYHRRKHVVNEQVFRTLVDLALPTLAHNALSNEGIRNVLDLIQKTEAELLKIKNFGKRSLNAVKTALGETGLHLGMQIDPEELKRLQDGFEESLDDK